jgi:Bifunctional DNA primase/polymerase, N-terminal/AAA domain
MSTFREIALPLAERGFHVFPLIPRQKRPLPIKGDADHFDAATVDPLQIEAWNVQKPDANVGLAPDEIFCFLETDDEAELKAVCGDLPPEIWETTRVSASPNRCYYIFRQTSRTRKTGNMTLTREGRENLFEFKQHRALCVGPGSTHPSGRTYNVTWQDIPAMPDALLNRLCEAKGADKPTAKTAMSAEAQKQTELLDRFLDTYEVATLGDWFSKGRSWYRPIECPWADQHENENEGTSTCVVFTEGGGYGFDCKHRCADKGWREFRAELQTRHTDKRFSFVEPDCSVTIGAGTVPNVGAASTVPNIPVDWRAHYHSIYDHDHVGPPEFLIEGFLQRQAIMGIGAFVGQKKTLQALNIAWSLCSGEPLFGRFKVVRQPTRVLYLGPENGMISFAARVNQIGLREYMGKTFFYTTMSMPEKLPLTSLTPEEIGGAVIFIDTAIRYTEGNENDASQMKGFAELAFSLIRGGAESVVLLHHSPKSMTKANELTLENSFRGTGELSAFLSVALAMRTQDMNDEYNSASLIRFVKQRDFEPKPSSFEVTTDRATCRMTFVEGSHGATVAKTPANADGRKADALQVIRDNPHLSLSKIAAKLKAMGIKRSKSWVGNQRYEIVNSAIGSSTVHAPRKKENDDETYHPHQN